MNTIRYVFLMFFFLISAQVSAAGQPDLEAIKQAAEQGDAIAQSQLASAYYLGQGISEDRKQAAVLFNKAAVQGDLDSMVMLAAMNDAGLGVGRNLANGKSWYKKAADLGHEPSKGVLSYYTDQERPLKAMQIAAQYAKQILKKK